MKQQLFWWGLIIIIGVIAVGIVVVAGPWLVNPPSLRGSKVQEGISTRSDGAEIIDDIKYSSTIQSIFMKPPQTKLDDTYEKQTMTNEFGVATDYWVPKEGWYIIQIKEPIEDPKNNRHISDYVPRMTMKLDGVPVLPQKLDILNLKNSKYMSKQMDANSMNSIQLKFANEKTNPKSNLMNFFNRNSASPEAADVAQTKKNMSDFDAAEKSGNFDESQKALIALKEQADKQQRNIASEAVAAYDVSNSLLQYDSAMPAFWEPGSFRNVAKTYIPSYEDSVFLSQSTGLPEYSNVKNRPDQMGGFCTQLGKGVDASAMEDKCNSLDADVCASTTCCVLLGGSKCVAGNMNGPSVSSNYSDTTIQNRDFYYFKGKCYGNCYQNGASSMYEDTEDKYARDDDESNDFMNEDDSVASPSSSPAAQSKNLKIGDTVQAIYNSNGTTNPARIAAVLSDSYYIEWLEGNWSGKADYIDKKTLRLLSLLSAPPAPAPAKTSGAGGSGTGGSGTGGSGTGGSGTGGSGTGGSGTGGSGTGGSGTGGSGTGGSAAK